MRIEIDRRERRINIFEVQCIDGGVELLRWDLGKVVEVRVRAALNLFRWHLGRELLR